MPVEDDELLEELELELELEELELEELLEEELDEELLDLPDEELLLEEELLEDEVGLPEQPAIAADNSATLAAKSVLFIVFPPKNCVWVINVWAGAQIKPV